MIVRFCLYSILKNLRFFEVFFLIYLLAGPTVGGPRLDFLQIGLLVGYQKLLTGTLEIPLGVATDRFGRIRALAVCFACYVVAFPLYAGGGAQTGGPTLVTLYVAQSFFGLGEALRTGTHKAIMLDWVDSTGRSSDATRILSMTRFFSKTSAGLSAFAGGVLLWWLGSFVWLFWIATVPAGLGLLLVLTYPDELNGEQSRRDDGTPPPSLWLRTQRLWATPGLVLIMGQSILFESQIKVLQHYIQPFLKAGLEEQSVAVVGALGAIVIGTYYGVQDLVGGLSSMTSVRVERALGGGRQALLGCSLAAVLASTVIATGLSLGWLGLGISGFLLVGLLQNARRPIFVAELNTLMDGAQRATTLSIESQARNWAFGLAAPATGWLADQHGLGWATAPIPVILIVGLGLEAARRRTSRLTPP